MNGKIPRFSLEISEQIIEDDIRGYAQSYSVDAQKVFDAMLSAILQGFVYGTDSFDMAVIVELEIEIKGKNNEAN